MAGWLSVTDESMRHNRVRNVRTVASYRAAAFWERARGNFLLSGGLPETRAHVLSEKLCHEMAYGTLPSIVLTASSELEWEMVNRMTAGTPGTLRVTSTDSRNYHFFYHWNEGEIVRFLTSAAELLKRDSTEMPVYLSALLEILRTCYEPSLSALTGLAAYQDAEIAEIGRRQGASSEAVWQITHYAQGGEMFRRLLEQVSEIFLPLTTEQCNTRCNLSTWDLNGGAVWLINLRSSNPDVMYAYFSMELRRLLEQSYAVRIVCSDLSLAEDSPLWKVFLECTDSMARETGLSISRAAAVPDREAIGRFSSIMLLLNGGFVDGDIEEILRTMGTYEHYEPVKEGNRAAGLFQLFTGSVYRHHIETRLRVRPEDIPGYSAVLYGANGREILLTRNLL